MGFFDSAAGEPGFINLDIQPVRYEQLNLEPLARVMAKKQAIKSKIDEDNQKARQEFMKIKEPEPFLPTGTDIRVSQPFQQGREGISSLIDQGYDYQQIMSGIAPGAKEYLNLLNPKASDVAFLKSQQENYQQEVKSLSDSQQKEIAMDVSGRPKLYEGGTIDTKLGDLNRQEQFQGSYAQGFNQATPFAVNKYDFNDTIKRVEDALSETGQYEQGREGVGNVGLNDPSNPAGYLRAMVSRKTSSNLKQLEEAKRGYFDTMPKEDRMAWAEDFLKQGNINPDGTISKKYYDPKTGDLTKTKMVEIGGKNVQVNAYEYDLMNHIKNRVSELAKKREDVSDVQGLSAVPKDSSGAGLDPDKYAFQYQILNEATQNPRPVTIGENNYSNQVVDLTQYNAGVKEDNQSLGDAGKQGVSENVILAGGATINVNDYKDLKLNKSSNKGITMMETYDPVSGRVVKTDSKQVYRQGTYSIDLENEKNLKSAQKETITVPTLNGKPVGIKELGERIGYSKGGEKILGAAIASAKAKGMNVNASNYTEYPGFENELITAYNARGPKQGLNLNIKYEKKPILDGDELTDEAERTGAFEVVDNKLVITGAGNITNQFWTFKSAPVDEQTLRSLNAARFGKDNPEALNEYIRSGKR
jgi:hypothetical protein